MVLYSRFIFAQELYSQLPNIENELSLQNGECPRLGAISGRLIVPEENNNLIHYDDIAIRLAGIDYSNEENKQFEYYPNENGCFVINSPLPVGTTISLLVWDKKGLLYSKIVPVYVGSKSNYYNIILNSYHYVSNLSEYSTGKKQLFENSGMCGYAIGLSLNDMFGVNVSLVNSQGKEFTPKYYKYHDMISADDNILNKLAGSGRFCFFNVNPCSNDDTLCSLNSDYYKLIFSLKDGSKRTFNLFLYANTFSNYNYYDLASSIYRPIKFLSVKNYFGNNLESDWSYDDLKLYYKTSEDYAESIYLNSNNENKLIYFPFGDDFVNINYKMAINQEDRYFILKPRAEIFSERLFASLKEYEPGQIYVDRASPIFLKIFNPSSLENKEEFLSPIFNKDVGSVFLSLDISNYAIGSDEVSVNLVDYQGRQNYSFNSIQSTNTNSLSGFFYNLKPGMYQLYVVDNLEGSILYSSIVQSIANKTQIITESIENSNDDENINILEDQTYIVNSNYQVVNNHAMNFINNEENSNLNFSIDEVKLEDNNVVNEIKRDIESLRQEGNFFRKNIFNSVSSETLCNVSALQENPILEAETRFMDFIPEVKVLPTEQLVYYSTEKISNYRA